MPISTAYLDRGVGVVLTGSGFVTGRQFLDAIADVAARGITEYPIIYRVFDANGMTAVEVSVEELKAMARLDIAAARTSKDCLVAIVANSDVSFGLARMWMVFVEESGWETAVFRDRAQAVAWLTTRASAKFGITIGFA